MKYNNIEEYKDSKLDLYNFANIFDVVQKGEKSYFNICKTIRIQNLNKMLPEYYTTYEVTPKDTWANISYKFYNTYKLWWIICKFNDIKNPFTQLQQGQVIIIPTKQLVLQIAQGLIHL